MILRLALFAKTFVRFDDLALTSVICFVFHFHFFVLFSAVPADFDVLSATNLSAQMFPLSRQNSVPITKRDSSQSMLSKLANKLSKLVFHSNG